MSWGGSPLDYAELWQRITGMASRLARADVRPGDRVLLDLTAGAKWIVSLLGVLEAGGQAIVPDTAWGPAEVAAHSEQLKPAAVIWSEGVDQAHGHEARRASGVDGPAGIWLFTSGTTDTPRPRFRSVADLDGMVDRLLPRVLPALDGQPPRALALAPIQHGFALLNALLFVLAAGGSVHGSTNGLDTAWDQIDEHGLNSVYGWPSQFTALSTDPAAPRHKTLRWCISSADRLDPEVAARFEAATGCPVRQQYGTTETGPLTLDSAEPADPRSVGTALAGVEIRVTGVDGEALPPGAVGRIGARVTTGASANLAVDSDGYHQPGDRGFLSPDGKVFLTGRERPFTDERAMPEGVS